MSKELVHDELVHDIGTSVFSNMGAPKQFSDTQFRKEFRKELEKRTLGKDSAQYRYLFGQVIRTVKAFVKYPPPSLSPPSRPVDFKMLAANDRS